MTLKTFRGSTMAEALTEVKKTIGRDAVILHTRTYKVGGVFGVGGRQVVEITASDTMNSSTAVPPRSDRIPARRAAGLHETVVGSPTPTSLTPARMKPADGAPLIEIARRVDGDRVATVPHVSGARSSGRLATPAHFSPDSAKATEALRSELSAIRSLVTHLVRASPARNESASLGVLPDALFDAHARLTAAGVSAEVAAAIISPLRNAHTPAALSDPANVKTLVLARLTSMLRVSGGVNADVKRDGAGSSRSASRATSRPTAPYTIALIGPTGVGKTTTIAKVAALQRLRHNKRVGLVTTDTYRIAAVDQLRTYANIIGLPVRVAASPAEMERACASLDDCDLIFVDTAGRSPHDAARLDELRLMLAACRPDEEHLVLSMAAAESVLNRTVERFQGLAPDRLILTKLDEAVTFGSILNLAASTGLPISFVTDGQEVPDQIEVADSSKLAALVWGEAEGS